MSITKESELIGMKNVSEAVAVTLKGMREYAKPGMSTKTLDDFGKKILQGFGAKSAISKYGFPGWTCISINNEFCHGIPSENKILKEGDLINIDVSAELDGFWADNGGSFVLGKDLYHHQPLIEASQNILRIAINSIRSGVKIADIGCLIEIEAKKRGCKVIKNLGGHGVGRSLHEQPDELLNYKNRFDQRRFKNNSVVAIETFISTTSTYAIERNDGWRWCNVVAMAQHEHNSRYNGEPLVLTAKNGILN